MPANGDPNSGPEELPPSAIVMRLVPLKDTFIPTGAAFPTTAAFDPSTDDEQEAARHNLPVRVSVWDRARTTAAQARVFRTGEGDVRSYEIGVGQVNAIREKLSHSRLRVVRDYNPSITGDGADGHCGIEGLDRLPGTPRQVMKDLKLELVRCLREVLE